MNRQLTRAGALASLSAAALGALSSLAAAPPASADPLPYGPDTCIQGFVWRDGRAGDHVCVTPDVRSQTAAQNAAAAANRQPGGGAYGPNTCKQGFVWRDAWGGDQVCVVPAVRDQAATDNAAATSRRQTSQPAPAPQPAPPPPPAPAPPPPPPAPKQGPGVSWDPRIGGLTAHITDRSGVASQCTYTSDFYQRSFFLPANQTYDLVIVPAIPKFQNWNVTVKCDNGTTTNTSEFF
ncbi:hypothetical protein TUM20983_47250 [Mycobacterium antarcticum]|uniref:hypothetical protein n=1 Tax=Mycolicibacterium sp. TUM20983 TaxID=3023369 RepID=UPI0023A4EF01|nr:hypothetical protein [Mycolicibacterium sp. TUM20983]GLP77615.1 hypothetical protein TUM20983_47250 [Mycolicibacterium sp. TUM20983]